MALNSTHPDYAKMIDDWTLMRDAYEGERVVKSRGTTYLPATPSQVLDGMKSPTQPGAIAYAAYKTRAVFPDFVSDAVERHIGMMHQKPATFELPAQLEPLLKKATIDGESLEGLLRRINEQQLVTGRLGLLLDFPENPVDATQPLPYIAMYYGETIINWDNSEDHQGVNAITLVVLNETGPVRDADFTWTDRERYRVLQLGQPIPEMVVDGQTDTNNAPEEISAPNDATEGVGVPVYMQGVFDMANGGSSFSQAAMKPPMYRGKVLEQVPFVFINSKDIIPSPDNPPLLGLGRLAMTVYRGEADYRHTLFMQGQETLVTIGSVQQNGAHVTTDDPIRVGAGAHIGLDPTAGADAKYIGIGAEGLTEQRSALENDRKEADTKSGTMISPSAGKQESGDALSTRMAAQTASLMQLAKTGAMALENLLKVAATWMGADPEKVKVTPNLEFAKISITGQELTQVMAARAMGAPLSLESIHSVLRDRGWTQMDYETELDKIEEEDAGRAARNEALGLDATGQPMPPAPAPKPAPARSGAA